MGIQSSGCAAVDAIGNIVITGNITPPRWYKEIRKENGNREREKTRQKDRGQSL